jgi:uncharacterized protein
MFSEGLFYIIFLLVFFMEDKVSRERLDRYFGLTGRALDVCRGSVVVGREEDAKEIFEMVSNYLSDAKFFDLEKGDVVLAFGAVNYAHGWLDCGVRLGIFDVDDRDLFTVC